MCIRDRSKRIGILPEFVPWGAPKGEVHRGGTAASPGHSPVERNAPTAEQLLPGTGDHRDLHSFPTRRSSDLLCPLDMGESVAFPYLACLILRTASGCDICLLYTSRSKVTGFRFYPVYQPQFRDEELEGKELQAKVTEIGRAHV